MGTKGICFLQFKTFGFERNILVVVVSKNGLYTLPAMSSANGSKVCAASIIEIIPILLRWYEENSWTVEAVL